MRILLITTLLFLSVNILPIFAQDVGDGTMPPPEKADATTDNPSMEIATSSSVSPAGTSPTGVGSGGVSTTTSQGSPSRPVPGATPPSNPAIPASPTLPVSEEQVPTQLTDVIDENVGDSTSSGLVVAVTLFVVALMLGYGLYRLQTKKEKTNKEDDKKDKSRCFDIKQLLDKKMDEITDLKGQLENKSEEKAREVVRDVVTGKPLGEILTILEGAEKEYKRLKKLYEECMIDFGSNMLKGIIIENSLSDKKILDKVKIEKTRHSKDWVLHDVSVTEDQIKEISKNLASGPWYVHFWQPGKDQIKVIFKDKVFNIKYSDKSTWASAVAYGLSIGIPEDQLDFRID